MRARAATQMSIAVLGAGLALGCAPRLSPLPPRPSLVVAGEGVPAAVVLSPARWEYHPQRLPDFVRSQELPGGGQLLVTADGERWGDVSGENYAAVALPAPEPLVGSLGLGADGWLFVGASGTAYEAQEALGPFLRSSAPPEPLVRVAVSERAILGVDRRGRLLRSTDMGLSWTASKVPGRVADVALLPSGSGLALLFPEALLETTDGGGTWRPLTRSSFGAVRLRTTTSALQVLSLLNSRTFTPTQAKRWREGVDPIPTLALKSAIPTRPDAAAINEHRAVFYDGEYLEVRRVRREWKLMAGTFSGPLRVSTLELAKGCRDVRLSGREKTLILACVEERTRVAPLRFWRSDNWGKTWNAEALRVRGRLAALQVAVANRGTVVLAGICPPDSSERGCEPHGVYARTRPGAPLRSSNIPALRGLPKWLGTSRDGERVFALGTRTKSDALVVFSSDNHGRTFAATEIAGLDAISHRFRAQKDSLEVASAGVGDDAHVSISLRGENPDSWHLLVLDSQGQVVSLTQPPVSTAQVAGAGLSSIAYEPGSGEAWESADGGANWRSLGKLRVRFCDAGEKDCVKPVACHSKGCVFGDSLSRVGWRGGDAFEMAAATVRTDAVTSPRSFRSPFSCRFREDSQWEKLRGRRVPAASQAGIGDVAWFTFDDDLENGSVLMYEASWDSGGEVRSAGLFAPTVAGQGGALRASLQIEGVAALRTTGGRAEVAWRDLVQGRRTQRFTLPRSLEVPSTAARSAFRVAAPSLLSIAPGGLFIRPDSSGVTYFTDGRTVTETPPLPTIALPGHDEMVRVDGQSVAIRLLGGGAGIVRSKWDGGRWHQDAAAVGLLDPEPFALKQRFNIAYAGEKSGFHLMHLEGAEPRGWVFPFSAGAEPFAAAIAVPSQQRLANLPRPCKLQERRQTPRVILPKQAGTSHLVVVSDSAEPIGTLVTNQAVLYGTPNSPCAAFFDAHSVRNNASEVFRALLSADEKVPSWLFRVLPNATDFAYRAMDCRIDPGLVISDASLGTAK